jgi:uncharacterized membrane protein YphA (DoxX/SURF4 family)
MAGRIQREKKLPLTFAGLSRWGLGLIFLFAGLPKLFNWHDFAMIVDSYALLPDFLVVPAAIAIALLEVIAAVLLICDWPQGLWGVSALLLLFIGVLSYAIWQGLDIDCGCFGPEDPEHRAFAGLRMALVRDFLLCIPVLYLFWNRRQTIKTNNVEED